MIPRLQETHCTALSQSKDTLPSKQKALPLPFQLPSYNSPEEQRVEGLLRSNHLCGVVEDPTNSFRKRLGRLVRSPADDLYLAAVGVRPLRQQSDLVNGSLG